MNICASYAGRDDGMGGRNRSFSASTATETHFVEIINFIFTRLCTTQKEKYEKGTQRPRGVREKIVIPFLFSVF